MGTLILSLIGPYLITRIGGAVISGLLVKYGVSRAAAGTLAPQLAAILAKLVGGKSKELTAEEEAALAAYVQQTTQKEVAAHPGTQFHPV